jgi:hypothetical protein
MTPEQQLEVMQQVAGLLSARGLDATFEYPGYIGVMKDGHEVAFGTVNGPWGWNDAAGNGGDLGIRGSERDPEKIAAAIERTVQQEAFGFANAPKPLEASKQAAAQVWLGHCDMGGDDHHVVGRSKEECQKAFFDRYLADRKAGHLYGHPDFQSMNTMEEFEEYFGPSYWPVAFGQVVTKAD